MTPLDWSIIAGLLLVLSLTAAYTARLSRSVSGFLAAERCGRRYLIAGATAMAGTGLISLVYWFELHYEVGFAGVWWSSMTEPALIVIALSGWVVYRFRQTRALTLAQFFEMRYGRRFRVFAGTVAWLAGIINFGIYPAVGARVFIAMCDLPPSFAAGPIEVSTFPALMAGLLSIALAFTFVGGQVTVMVTDFVQGAFANIVFAAVAIFLVSLLSWDRIGAVLLEPPVRSSLAHPFQVDAAGEFNIWYFMIAIIIVFYTFNAWQGTQGYQVCASTPHEAKMANLLYGWRFRVLLVITVVVPIAVHTLLRHPDFAAQAATIEAGLDAVEAPNDLQRQTLQNQLRTPYALAAVLPAGLLGLMIAAMLAAFISTHDSYLHSWGSIFVQDVWLPLRRRAFTPRQHIRALRLSIFGVALFIYCFSLLVRPTQYIAMFFAITAAVFVGGAGAAIVGGLYWKRGNAAGAWAAMITSIVLAGIGIIVKQIDAAALVPAPDSGFAWPGAIARFLQQQLTGQELTFWTMVCAVAAYVVASLLSPDPRIDMDKLLHRGAHRVAGEDGAAVPPRRRTRWLERLGIDPEFTGWDRVVAAVSIGWPLVWTVLLLVITVWNLLDEWSNETWVSFWRAWTWIVLAASVAVTIWFTIGGARDLRWLVRELRRRPVDEHDDGRVDHDAFVRRS